LPAKVTGRAKTGFTTPIAGWQRQLEGAQNWRESDLLTRQGCPWARRWAYVVANSF